MILHLHRGSGPESLWFNISFNTNYDIRLSFLNQMIFLSFLNKLIDSQYEQIVNEILDVCGI